MQNIFGVLQLIFLICGIYGNNKLLLLYIERFVYFDKKDFICLSFLNVRKIKFSVLEDSFAMFLQLGSKLRFSSTTMSRTEIFDARLIMLPLKRRLGRSNPFEFLYNTLYF